MRRYFLAILILFPHILFPALVQGTLVKTPMGFIPIEQLAIGDNVLSYQDEHIVENRIINITATLPSSIYKIATDTISFYASADQPLYDPYLKQWIPIESLNTTSQLFSLKLGALPLSSIPYDHRDLQFYDISLEAPQIS